jgi:hypothetical protein
MTIAWALSALGLFSGALIGLALMLRPEWAPKVVHAGAAAPAARAAFGGMLAAAHGLALAVLTINLGYRDLLVAAIGVGFVGALGAGWAGAAVARFATLWRARKFAALKACGLEAGLALLIAAPMLVWLVAALTA